MSQILRILTPFKRWFTGLPSREQRAVKILLTFLAMLFLWKELWQPVQEARDRNEAAYEAAYTDFQWMQAHMQQAKLAIPQSATTPSPDGSSLLALTTDTAQTYRIAISHAEPAEDGSLRLTLESVAFSKLLPWLESLQREHNIDTSQLSMERQTDKPGYVSATLTLQQH